MGVRSHGVTGRSTLPALSTVVSAFALRLSNHRVSAAVLSSAAHGSQGNPANSPLRTH